MTIEHEQNEAIQKVAQVKEELAALKAAVKKKEQSEKVAEKTPAQVLIEANELFIERKDAKKVLTFEQKTVEKSILPNEKPHPTLDVSPGAHTVVEL
jgi:DNA repair ATPase RecN